MRWIVGANGKRREGRNPLFFFSAGELGEGRCQREAGRAGRRAKGAVSLGLRPAGLGLFPPLPSSPSLPPPSERPGGDIGLGAASLETQAVRSPLPLPVARGLLPGWS